MTRALSGGSLHLNPCVYPYPGRVYQESLGRRTTGKKRKRREEDEEKEVEKEKWTRRGRRIKKREEKDGGVVGEDGKGGDG